VRGFTLMLILALTACAHRPPGSPREELAGLEQRIAVLKSSSQQELASDPDRCRKQRAVADEICHCAGRICILSEDLGEAAACTKAREDCRQARANAESCL
jgi:hypothetical protein